MLLLLLPASAFASDEVLSFRFNVQGQVEAVVTGLTDTCKTGAESRYTAVTSITIKGNAIQINSKNANAFCTNRASPPISYSVSANLGHLDEITYQVTGTLGNPDITPPLRSLSATLDVPDLFASIGAPALSEWCSACSFLR